MKLALLSEPNDNQQHILADEVHLSILARRAATARSEQDTYPYVWNDSRISHFFRRSTNELNISQQGEALCTEQSQWRTFTSGCNGWPIVFVPHSLGGLLVKEALIESRKQPHSDKADCSCRQEGSFFRNSTFRL